VNFRRILLTYFLHYNKIIVNGGIILEKNKKVLVPIFPHRVKALRIQKDLKLKHVSSGTGLHVSTLGNYETGSKPPSLEAVLALAKFYDVSLDYLTGFDLQLAKDSRIKICMNIKELRLKMEFTQKDFATLAGIHVYEYEMIEEGQLPDKETILRICHRTTTTITDLTGYSENELDNLYNHYSVKQFAEDVSNVDYIMLAMKLKKRGLSPEDVIFGIKL
jgi:transcriptional regulator with XRE-family HTH domain